MPLFQSTSPHSSAHNSLVRNLGRRYLEVMTKVDRLMPMLETLAIDEVIEVSQLDLQKACRRNRCAKLLARRATLWAAFGFE